MKASVCLVVTLAAATACRTAAPIDANALPKHRPITEATMPEYGEPSRRAGLELADTLPSPPNRAIPSDSLRKPH